MANAVELLKEDHQKVKDLFDRFEKAQDAETLEGTVHAAIHELKVHSRLEEELFYPIAEEVIAEKFLVIESREAHHVVDGIIAELEFLGAGHGEFSAKFRVLAENVRRHIQEEETNLFPQVESAGVDLEALGARMGGRKEELQAEVEKPGHRSSQRSAGARGRKRSKARGRS